MHVHDIYMVRESNALFMCIYLHEPLSVISSFYADRDYIELYWIYCCGYERSTLVPDVFLEQLFELLFVAALISMRRPSSCKQ